MYWQDTCEKKWYVLFLSKKNLLVVLTCWKRNTFQMSMKFHFKKRKIMFETSFSPLFDVLHSSRIVYMDHTELIFQDFFYIATKRSQKSQSKFPLSSRGLNTLPCACSNLDLLDTCTNSRNFSIPPGVLSFQFVFVNK